MPTTAIKQTKRAYEQRLDTKQEIVNYQPAVMGDGRGNIRVTTLQSHAWVRIGDEESPAKVLNTKVPYIDDLAVWVGVDPVDGIDQVMGLRSNPYLMSGQTFYPSVPEHHESHEWEAYSSNGGYDLVWPSFEQITTLMLRPASDLGNFWVRLNEGPMPRSAGWVWISAANGNTVTLDFSGDVPGAGGIVALAYIDSNGDLQRRLSGVVAISALDISLTPAPNTGEYPIASVFLYSTQTHIQHNYSRQDIWQLRYPQYTVAGEDQLAVGNRKLLELGY